MPILHTSLKGNKPYGINQDYVLVAAHDTKMLASVSDGLGSAHFSHVGAKVACSIIYDNFILNNTNNYYSFNLPVLWNSKISLISYKLSSYKTTSSFMYINCEQKTIIVGQVGDTMVSLRIDNQWIQRREEEKDFTNETTCLGGHGLQAYQLEMYSYERSVDFIVASDGIADEIDSNSLSALHSYLLSKYKDLCLTKRQFMFEKEIKESFEHKNSDDKSIVFGWL